ncbi:protein-L-isoaspartate O-methyltransferase [Allomyces macrogynus ATCC 38327]|uniref:Protein-L-isoaspartate O-methyltransferase n=1 Tax=Allomyces macrogynus (strain ATCC 38327) TaxID=578462 RepID=A0A0L0T2I4_ALLM3|nr:protein-L-isoaspartate O-methyltransferase [Allomyces macrogynus ATCC 38327]|eukprot:KNE68865.1 protein-L-isoaspartate O-methyltransferase [Allomyces macrogynus ATCC 38327]
MAQAPAPLALLLFLFATRWIQTILFLVATLAMQHLAFAQPSRAPARLFLDPTPSIIDTMAWRCSAKSNARLVENLFDANIITNPRVKSAMFAIDRGHYVHPGSSAYMDAPQTIGYSATISAPHMHAYALNLLEPYLRPGNRVLDVGCGSGYLTACMADMVGPEGKVVALDHIEELVEMTRANVERDQPGWTTNGRVECVVGDGREGYPARAPYSAIHVGAAAATIPQPLVDQLASPGRMILPVARSYGGQALMQVDKDQDGTVTTHTLMGVMYVPLTDKDAQLSGAV